MASGTFLPPGLRQPPGRASDDEFFTLGTDEDVVFVLSSSAISADAEPTGLIEGTSDHQGVAANSLVVSNITDDGDMMFLVSNGGNSLEFLNANADSADLQIGHGMATVTVKTASGDLSLSPAAGDINIPSAIGLTFADDGQKIESDGTDFTIASGGKLNLTPVADSAVHIANGTGLVIGHTAQLTIGNPANAEFQVHGTANPDSSMLLGRWSANDDPPRMGFVKSKGTIGNYTTVANNDRLGAIEWYAADGSDANVTGAKISAVVDTTADSVAGDRIPTELIFSTAKGAADNDLAARMTIKPTGEIDFHSNALGITNVGSSGNDWTENLLTLSNENSGGRNSIRIANLTNDDLNSHAELQIASEGTGGGDPFIHFRIGGIQSMSMGLDNSDTTGPDRFVWSEQQNGIGTNDRMRLDPDSGVLSVDGDGGGSDDPVLLFDAYDDAVELERYAHATLDIPDISPEQRIANREHLVEMGVAEWAVQDEGPDHLMIKMQPMTKLLAGGIYQTRHRMDAQNEAMDARLKRIEQALGV